MAPALLAALAACAGDPLRAVRETYAAGDYAAARDALEELAAADPSNRHLYAMERSLTELALRQPAAAEGALRGARDRLDELSGDGAAEWLAAVLLDDRQLDYAGADYEQVLVRALLAVSNLFAGGTDAEAYALQVLAVQRAIIDSFEQDGVSPKQAYKLVAFGSYVRAILAEDDPLRLGVAREAYARVCELEPELALGRAGLERVSSGQHSPRGYGAVHVLALVGRGPFRVETDARVTRDVLAIAQVIWALHRDRATFPNIAAVAIPALAFHTDNPTEVHVAAGGHPAAITETVTDVEVTAQREFEAMHAYIVARAALRRAFKIVVTEGLKEVVNRPERDQHGRRREPNPLTDLLISLGGLLWSAVEQADLRCWGLLPARFEAARLELPAGEHVIELRAGYRGHPIGAPQRVRVLVRDGFNTYVLGLVPTTAGGPEPLTSDPAGGALAGAHNG